MQKCLIISFNPSELPTLEALFSDKDLKVRFVEDLTLAEQLLVSREYEILILTEELSEPELQKLGTALWAKSPSALAITTRVSSTFSNSPTFYRMFGFVPIDFNNLKAAVLDVLKKDSFAEPKKQSDFPILVVEDLDSPRDIICIFLESLGYKTVQGCRSASEGLALLESDPQKYSCVVTDIRMPKISGKEMIEIIRSHPKLQHLPIIVLTAYGTLDMLVECLKVGASGFLVKPPKKEDMQRELARASRIHSKKESPRLATPLEAEYIRDMVESRKVT